MSDSLSVLTSGKEPTMSSLEMVDYINADRKAKAEAAGLKYPCKEYRLLKHNDLLKRFQEFWVKTNQGNFSQITQTAKEGPTHAIASLSERRA